MGKKYVVSGLLVETDLEESQVSDGTDSVRDPDDDLLDDFKKAKPVFSSPKPQKRPTQEQTLDPFYAYKIFVK